MSKSLIHDDQAGDINIQDKLSEDFERLLLTGQNADIIFVLRGDNNVERIPGEFIVLASPSIFY